MDYKAVLRCQPWIRLVNKHGISFRFLQYTKGDMFIGYNNLTGDYEIHSVRSYQLTGSSCNGVLEENQVNGFAYYQFRESELKKFLLDITSQIERTNHLYDSREDQRDIILKNSLTQIERTLGTRV